MKTRFIVFSSLLLGASVGCGGGKASGPPVDAAEYKDAEALNPRLDDGRTVHLGFDTHHPECFVFTGEGTERKTEELECPEPALRLKDCPGGVVYRSRAQSGCICVSVGGDDPRRIACPQ